MSSAGEREHMIRSYINAYNSFDIDGMLEHLDKEVVFENYLNGDLNLELKNKEEFREQAEKMVDVFSSRKQEIVSIEHESEKVNVEVQYSAVLAMTVSEDLKAGSEIKLEGRSIFSFEKNKIVKIVDLS
ncbi:nuclear transport factor 2 family protein [Leptobacterium flavescens]|uniref:Nuclear transport factor 2 family protein n=1 Tax=Leptobacterium flavescens TaxID=472055 RepID=A0A6P0UGT7_9FLAO|nr:nuclear transport factor 2 family protein [Leptobacterium flavescens]NER12511.1 nuclear transport factor 2 family protein [Leptobacterium flavescens]